MKKISKIALVGRTDDIKDHRYASIDDWTDPLILDDGLMLPFQVADMKNVDYNFLVLLHALVEQYLCYRHGIKDETVTKYDMEHLDSDDPGNNFDAPYQKEHLVATDVESKVANALGINWVKYEEAISKTVAKWKKSKK